MLPLGKFPVLRGGSPADAFASIRMRHPGLREFMPVERRSNWEMDINAISLGAGRLSASVTSACSLQNVGDGMVRIIVPLNSPVALTVRGARRRLDQYSAWLLPSAEFRCDYEDGSRNLVLAFPMESLSATLLELDPGGNVRQAVDAALERGAGSFRGLRGQLLSVVRAIDGVSSPVLEHARFLKAHEELLLFHIADHLMQRRSDPSSPGSASFTRALEFMHAHIFDEIGPTAIARAAGCSLRNLQLLFRREKDATITEVLRDMRLEAARSRLTQPMDGDTITAIASDCGFSHLGDFARHYRRAFGETPSATLAIARS